MADGGAAEDRDHSERYDGHACACVELVQQYHQAGDRDGRETE
jgi:hypothetical protein